MLVIKFKILIQKVNKIDIDYELNNHRHSLGAVISIISVTVSSIFVMENKTMFLFCTGDDKGNEA